MIDIQGRFAFLDIQNLPASQFILAYLASLPPGFLASLPPFSSSFMASDSQSFRGRSSSRSPRSLRDASLSGSVDMLDERIPNYTRFNGLKGRLR